MMSFTTACGRLFGFASARFMEGISFQITLNWVPSCLLEIYLCFGIRLLVMKTKVAKKASKLTCCAALMALLATWYVSR